MVLIRERLHTDNALNEAEQSFSMVLHKSLDTSVHGFQIKSRMQEEEENWRHAQVKQVLLDGIKSWSLPFSIAPASMQFHWLLISLKQLEKLIRPK